MLFIAEPPSVKPLQCRFSSVTESSHPFQLSKKIKQTVTASVYYLRASRRIRDQNNPPSSMSCHGRRKDSEVLHLCLSRS